MRRVDARGLSCPHPVILARNAIQAGAFPIEVLVDTATAKENVTRMAEKAGLAVRVDEQKGEFCLTLTR